MGGLGFRYFDIWGEVVRGFVIKQSIFLRNSLSRISFQFNYFNIIIIFYIIQI